MRCPNCEQWNRSSLPRCSRCGTELKAAAPVEPSWRAKVSGTSAKAYIRVDEDGHADVTPDRRDVLAQEMSELKIRKDDGNLRLQQLMTETASIPVIREEQPEEIPFGEPVEHDETFEESVPEQPEPTRTVPPSVPETTRRTARVAIHGLPDSQAPASTAHAASQVRRTPLPPAQWSDNRSYDPIVEDMQRQQQNVFRNAPQMSMQPAPHTRSRRRSTRRIVNILTTVLVIVVLVLAGAVAVSAWQRYKASISDDNRAIVTASMKDDQAAHTVLIPGEDGQKIYIRELHATYEVVGGFATIVIPDHTWYEDLAVVTDETMTVTLTPSLQTSGARQKALDSITYDISIPLSPITLISPEQGRTEVTTAMYPLEFQVRPGSVITVNGVDMSDAVDADGHMIYNATVQPKGDNVYTVNVRSPYCRDNSLDVVLYREVQEIPLDLAVTTYTSTSLDKYQITCTTLPGAEVDVLTPHSDLVITNLDSTGEFTFYAIFDKIGYNTVSIQATYPGKKTSRVDYVIYYLPSPDVYTRKAWSLANSADYAELMGNISFRAENTQIYVAIGTIDSFVSDSPQLAIMYCSADGMSQPVLLQNETKTEWKVGGYYRIYADVYGTYNGMPWLVARYTYVD